MNPLHRFRSVRTACLTWGAAAFLLGSAEAGEVVEIRTAAQLSSAPKFIQLPQQGRHAVGGLCIDIYRAIERVAPSLRFIGDQEWKPLTRIEAEMRKETRDAACGLIHNKEREASFDYLDPPLFSVSYFLVARADDQVRINNWDDVRALGENGTILVIHGFGPVARLKEMGGLQIDSGATDARTNLMKLVAGRGRFYYHRSLGLAEEIRRAGVEGRVKILPTVMDVQHFKLVVGRHLAPAARNKLEDALLKLESSGELKRLADKWHESPP